MKKNYKFFLILLLVFGVVFGAYTFYTNIDKENFIEATDGSAIDFLEYGKQMKVRMKSQKVFDETVKKLSLSELQNEETAKKHGILVIVGDKVLTERQVENTLFTADFAKIPKQREEVIQEAIRSFVVIHEVKRLGLEPTEEQVDAFIREMFEMEDFPEKQENLKIFEQIAEGLGVTLEEYFFETTRASYYETCAWRNLSDYFFEQNPSLKREDFMAYVEELVRNAEIIRFDM